MTRPPEYEQVAQWLRAINGDPELRQELASGYYDIKYATEDGLTLDRHIGERRQSLAEAGRRELGGIDLDGKSTAQIAGEYHARQIAECAHLIRDLEERIRALESGDFAVPAWCAQGAARDDISLAEAIERYRQDEIYAAAKALDYLDEYAVADHEIRAYWAEHDCRADYDSPGDGRATAAGRPGQGAPAPDSSSGFARGPLPAGPGVMSARAASSTVRPAEPAVSSPGIATGITGLPSRTSLEFPNPVTQGVPACPASPRRPGGQPGWPAARRTP